MTSFSENLEIRRKSSGIAALMTLNCSIPNSIPIINEPPGVTTIPVDMKKKALRFDINTVTSEYESEEVRENKRRITDEIKK
ncbi:CLUMA_CG021504, isoform A [Clunio marinus]|uniref:CLUMA_CG021504, isoform A n=1 Tax=Clunio marinus TaxID=568069 RepID=A0A1J1J8J5_9DIPT|nr:CLUMA_CG021504, isoform A [Clunio marinus]